MAEDGGAAEPGTTLLRRSKVPSRAHEHFDLVSVETDNGIVKNSVCKTCKTSISGKNPTNLKTHLKSAHKELYEDVMSK